MQQALALIITNKRGAGTLKTFNDATANAARVPDVAQEVAVLRHTRDVECVGLRPHAHHKVVVRHHVLQLPGRLVVVRAARIHVLDPQLLPLSVNCFTRGLQIADLVWLHPPHWLRNAAELESAHRCSSEVGGEQEVVSRADDDHVPLGGVDVLDQLEPCPASAQHNNTRLVALLQHLALHQGCRACAQCAPPRRAQWASGKALHCPYDYHPPGHDSSHTFGAVGKADVCGFWNS
mmetsp:Transcript_53405/g.134137  ORF Transcript_53405/g.134137 Transcript_53405/m.134137 type:complete len:235 (+) Transcript_53405:956-1660(+)